MGDDEDKKPTPFVHHWARMTNAQKLRYLRDADRELPRKGDRLLAINGNSVPRGIRNADKGLYDHTSAYRMLFRAASNLSDGTRLRRVKDLRAAAGTGLLQRLGLCRSSSPEGLIASTRASHHPRRGPFHRLGAVRRWRAEQLSGSACLGGGGGAPRLGGELAHARPIRAKGVGGVRGGRRAWHRPLV